MEKELSAAHAAAEAQMNRMQAEAAVEREKSEAALKESEQRCIQPLIIKPGRTHDLISCRAIADIERLQSQFAADRAQQQQQQQQMQSRMQADIDALRAAVRNSTKLPSSHSNENVYCNGTTVRLSFVTGKEFLKAHNHISTNTALIITPTPHRRSTFRQTRSMTRSPSSNASSPSRHRCRRTVPRGHGRQPQRNASTACTATACFHRRARAGSILGASAQRCRSKQEYLSTFLHHTLAYMTGPAANLAKMQSHFIKQVSGAPQAQASLGHERRLDRLSACNCPIPETLLFIMLCGYACSCFKCCRRVHIDARSAREEDDPHRWRGGQR